VSGPDVARLDHADPSTAEAIRAVMAAAYAVEAAVLGVDDFPPARRTAAQVAASDGRFVGVRVAGKLAAVAELERPERGRVHIGALVVQPSHFRRGLAGALLRHLLDAHPSDEVTVATGIRNLPALHLYAAHGFVERRRWTTGDGIPMVTLWRGARAPDRRRAGTG
jgi:GNAT superfamily N-acetyltransferase